MKFKELFYKEIKMKAYEKSLIVIITLLATLLLLNIWPRFRSDASSVSWYSYVILIVLFTIPFFIKKKNKQKCHR